jgi:hypothetical protein
LFFGSNKIFLILKKICSWQDDYVGTCSWDYGTISYSGIQSQVQCPNIRINIQDKATYGQNGYFYKSLYYALDGSTYSGNMNLNEYTQIWVNNKKIGYDGCRCAGSSSLLTITDFGTVPISDDASIACCAHEGSNSCKDSYLHVEVQILDKLSKAFRLENEREEVSNAVKTVILDTLQGKVYQQSKVQEWIDSINTNLLNQLKALNANFKLITSCMILEQVGSGLTSTSVSFWDEKTDGCVTVKWSNSSVQTIVTVFGTAL